MSDMHLERSTPGMWSTLATTMGAALVISMAGCAQGTSTPDAQPQGAIDAQKADSSSTLTSCGNFTCEPSLGEDCGNCSDDCGSCCGNTTCEPAQGESCSSCEADCGSCCGNSMCETGLQETCNSCPDDCGVCCGNGSCDSAFSETCMNCTADCGQPITDKNGTRCPPN